MSKSWTKGAFSNLSAKSVIFAVLIGVLCMFMQFFQELGAAKERSETSIAMLVSSLEKPAARAVLILDAELAQDIAAGLTDHDFVKSAKIFEDHSVVLGEASRDDLPPHSGLEKLIATFAGTEGEINRPLHLPESMSDATGEIRLTIDGPRAVAGAMSNICATLLATFFAITGLLLVAFALMPAGRDE
ncbi:MAG: hypothetical protein HWE25_03960 [Alphaproteobacteria bacterium]|nr:hypothetical protein [Alphaproteobacteria bacterium]